MIMTVYTFETAAIPGFRKFIRLLESCDSQGKFEYFSWNEWSCCIFGSLFPSYQI